MNANIRLEPRAAAILGALVADAAALGLHWLYDPERIAQIEQSKGVVFLSPDVRNYEGVSGYFAHGQKQAGDSSAYGELCQLMLRHVARHGKFYRVDYQSEYRGYFGPGGGYRGYVDSPTRQTLQKLLPLTPEEFPLQSGADDDQFAALATLPVIVATHTGSLDALKNTIEQVVRLTNHNDAAVAAAQYTGTVLHDVLAGKSIVQALNDALEHAGETLAPLLEEALQTQQLDALAAGKRFGSACHVPQGTPIIAHIAKHAPDYRTAVTENIRIGGDSCGRAIMLGAIMAAHTAQQNGFNSIPLEWAAKLSNLSKMADALVKLA